MGPREEAARGGEEMNHGTLWYSKWEIGFEERGSQWAVEKLLAWCSLLHPHYMIDNSFISHIDEEVT